MAFAQIPSDTRTPGAFTEIDPSSALTGTPARPKHLVVFAHKLSGGSAVAGQLYGVTGDTQGDALCGVGSHGAEMLRAFKAGNRNVRLSVCVVAEPGAGVAATGTFTIAGTATADGILAAYIGGVLVAVLVTSGQAAAAIATALAAAINANTRLPVTAAAVGAVVTCTARHKGLIGNDIPLEHSTRDVDALPAGVTCTIAAMASGAGAPDLASTIADLPEETLELVSGWNDDASLDAFEAELTRRWNAMVALDGILFAAFRGDHAATTSAGAARNCPFSTLAGTGTSPMPPWIYAAMYAATWSTESDPGRPLNGLPLVGALPPARTARFDRTERNLLLHSGVTPMRVAPGDIVVIDRAVTTYQKNAQNLADPTWLDLTVPTTLSFLRWSWNLRLAKFARHKAADDGTNFEPGQPVVTPSVIRGEALAWFKEMEGLGLVEGFELFKATLIVRRNTQDKNRFDVFMSPDVINGAHVVATSIGFRL